jgi:hypothetical protein
MTLRVLMVTALRFRPIVEERRRGCAFEGGESAAGTNDLRDRHSLPRDERTLGASDRYRSHPARQWKRTVVLERPDTADRTVGGFARQWRSHRNGNPGWVRSTHHRELRYLGVRSGWVLVGVPDNGYGRRWSGRSRGRRNQRQDGGVRREVAGPDGKSDAHEERRGCSPGSAFLKSSGSNDCEPPPARTTFRRASRQVLSRHAHRRLLRLPASFSHCHRRPCSTREGSC